MKKIYYFGDNYVKMNTRYPMKNAMGVKMVELVKEQMQYINDFYLHCKDSTVLSCLQGYMGRAWVDQLPNPTVSRIVQGDFCFPAGNANSVEADIILSEFTTEINTRELLIIPHTLEWEKKLENSNKYNLIIRYAIKKEGFIFSVENLLNYINFLSADYELRKIDEEIYDLVLLEEWSKDFCSNFKSAQDYNKCGLGFVIINNGKIICGASSYTVYKDGIEIQIATRLDYRRQGLATICGAKLLLECIKLNKYPNWDAANHNSVKIAEKLGYHFDKEYATYQLK